MYQAAEKAFQSLLLLITDHQLSTEASVPHCGLVYLLLKPAFLRRHYWKGRGDGWGSKPVEQGIRNELAEISERFWGTGHPEAGSLSWQSPFLSPPKVPCCMWCWKSRLQEFLLKCLQWPREPAGPWGSRAPSWSFQLHIPACPGCLLAFKLGAKLTAAPF